MKQLVMQIKYDAARLSALKQYASLKEISIESELCDTISKLYEKHVPAAVREFIEMNSQENDDVGQEQSQPKKERIIAKPKNELPTRVAETVKTQE